MNIVLEYPTWFVLLCALVGLAYALGLYYKDRSFGELSTRLNWGLGFLRWATVTIICLLLLSPVIKTSVTERKAPIVVVAQDNSESIRESMKPEAQAEYKAKMEALLAQLREKYEVKTYAFGERIRPEIDFSFSDKTTNIAAMLEELYDVYSNQNLTTVIVASDGIYNQGNNPIYAGTKLNVPIFAIALGDTIPKKDLVVKKVYNNQIAYLGDKFTVQADVAAINCSGNPTKLTVSKGGKVLYEKPLSIDNNDYFTTQEIILEANQSGVQKYTVAVSAVSGEVTNANNSKDFYIEVLDARQKILLLAESPHPDLGTLKRMISSNKNYEVKIAYPETLKESVAKYDFLVLHQLPSKRNAIADVLNTLETQKIPHLFVAGTQTAYAALNKAQGIVTINPRINQTNDVEGLLAPNFSLFTLNPKIKDEIFKFPPLTAPFGDFATKPNAVVLLTQKIGSVDSKYPLFVLGEERGLKKAVLAAEGFWKWRVGDYAKYQNFELFDELMTKAILYLSTKDDKRKFRAFVSGSLFNENERISIDAELYNANYERINDPEVRVEIKDEQGKTYPFMMNKTANAYALNVGLLPEGSYKFEAKTVLNGETLTAGGAFSVRSIQLEVFETTADHRLLSVLSTKNGGQLVYPSEIEKLAQLIQDKGFAKPLLFDTVQTRSLIHQKWIFFLLLGLLTAEWFLRRYHGSY